MIDLDQPGQVKLVPVDQNALAITSAFSYAEYAATYTESTAVLSNRWREARLTGQDQLYLTEYADWLHLLAVVEVDSPDTNILLPLLERIAQAGTRLSLHILTTDDDLTLLDPLLDEADLLDEDADLDFPILFFFDEEWEQQAQWGPRPQVADGYFEQWMAQHPEYETLMDLDEDEMSEAQEAELAHLTEQLYHEMRIWYAAEADEAAVSEIRAILAELSSDENSTDD